MVNRFENYPNTKEYEEKGWGSDFSDDPNGQKKTDEK